MSPQALEATEDWLTDWLSVIMWLGLGLFNHSEEGSYVLFHGIYIITVTAISITKVWHDSNLPLW